MTGITGAQQSLVEIRVPNQPEFLRVVRLLVSGYMSRLPFNIEEVENVKVAVSEACNNAMQYAFAPDEQGSLTIRCWHDQDRLAFEVSDTGKGFEASDGAAPDSANDERGLGFLLIQTLMDDVQVSAQPGTGTTVTMFKSLKG
jgi:serine/threonine-protein kinase RsbW